MMTFYKSAPLDQKRAKHAQGNERLSVAASFMIWVILAGFSWLGIITLIA